MDLFEFVSEMLNDTRGTRYVDEKLSSASIRDTIGWSIDGNISYHGRFIISKTGNHTSDWPGNWPLANIYYIYKNNILYFARTTKPGSVSGSIETVPKGFRIKTLDKKRLQISEPYHFKTKLNINQIKMLYELLLHSVEINMEHGHGDQYLTTGMNQAKLLDECWYSEEQITMSLMHRMKVEYDLYVEELTKNNKTLLSENTILLDDNAKLQAEIELLKPVMPRANNNSKTIKNSKKNTPTQTRKTPIPRGKPVRSKSVVVENI